MKILIHAHIFYAALWPELNQVIQNITTASKQFSSTAENSICRIICTVLTGEHEISEMIQRDNPHAEIVQVDNSGYDIVPFLKVCEMVDIASYDCIFHLHTKRNIRNIAEHVNYHWVYGARWREMLLEFVSSPTHAQQVLEIFQQFPQVGMVGNGLLYGDFDSLNIEWNRSMIGPELQHLKLQCDNYSYLHGTMFAVRPQVLFPWLHYVDFERFGQGGDHSIGLAHCYEMILGCAVCAAGLEFRDYAGRQNWVGTRWDKLKILYLWRLKRLLQLLGWNV